MNELEKEKNNLSSTINTIDLILSKECKELNNIEEDEFPNIEEYLRYTDMKRIHISNLEFSKEKPYFARLDFTENNGEKTIAYIGKNGIMDESSNIIVTDWRSPISSLYYNAEVGDCSFNVLDEIIYGKLNLKRQFEIENGNLLDYFDVDLVSSDVLLQKCLKSNNDNRLKNIVSTIQKEQNEVIRKKISENIIIQGVAGSGKTTVALHRIAYLVYNYMNIVSQKQYLVIGPNPVFLKYIKSVLPELDVSGVEQCTFEGFASKYIETELKCNSSEIKAYKNISGFINNDIDKFKCSIKYKDMINKFMNDYINNIINEDLVLNGFVIFSKNKIKSLFDESNNMSYLKTRIEETIERLCKLILRQNSLILEKYLDYSDKKYKNAKTKEERDKLIKQFAKDREEIKKGCRTTIRKYFSKVRYNPIALYKMFISTIEDYNIYNYENINLLMKETISNLRKNQFDFEDLAPLIYIKTLTLPNNYYKNMRQVVIDEAQDLGEFNFYVLKNCFSNASFSIFGDLAQSIYDYRGIDNWDEVNNIMFNNNGKIIKFIKSYRTTAEIMSVADNVAEYIGLEKSQTDIRHGEPVKFTKINKENDIPKYINEKIFELQNKGYKSIAIISKTDEMSLKLNEELNLIGKYIPNVCQEDDLSAERFKICTISNQLAKGLEFDAVILNNANEKIYSSNNKLDMKLLYVALTRSLHELDIVYCDELTNALIK